MKGKTTMSNFFRKVERNQKRKNGELKCYKRAGETRTQMRERIKKEKIEKRADLKIKENQAKQIKVVKTKTESSTK